MHEQSCWLWETAHGPDANIRRLMQQAVRKAVRKYGSIAPCGRRNSLTECFTSEGDDLYFWFNTVDKNTHLVVEKVQ